MDPDNLQKQTFFKAFLRHANFDGWSLAALQTARQDLNLPLAEVHRYYPNPLPDLARELQRWATTAMADVQAKKSFKKEKVRRKVYLLIRARLEAQIPYKAALKSLQWYLLQPLNLALGTRLLARTADDVWQLAGDTSQDLNYYSKRLLAGGVYASTLAYFLRDTSENHEKTWQFLENRIENVMRVGKMLNRKKSA